MRRSWLIREGKEQRAVERTNEEWLARWDFGRLGIEQGSEGLGLGGEKIGGRVSHGWHRGLTSSGNRKGAAKIPHVFLPQPFAKDVIEPHVLAVHHELGVHVLTYPGHGEEDDRPAFSPISTG